MEPLIAACVEAFSRYPGIGKKTALRLTLHVLKQPTEEVEQFRQALLDVRSKMRSCTRCFNLCETEVCNLCSDARRDAGLICVVTDLRDLLALEAAGIYQGLYHLLGGLIAPIEGVGPDKLNIAALLDRVKEEQIREVIFALPATMEGDTTAFYLARKLEPLGVKLTTIARGIAVGGELEYADELTLARSLSHRTPFQS